MRVIWRALALAAGLAWGGAAWAGTVDLDTRLSLLVAAYPQTLSRVADGKLFFTSGDAPLTVDDGRTKTHAEALEHADVEDMLSQIYPNGPCETRPAVNFDPGRIRSEALMKRLYGASRGAVAKRLTTVDWFGTKLRVTRAQGVDAALRKVRDDLAKMPKKARKPALKSAGTFNWRIIAGTKRLSVHSFGAAIDLDTAYANYWRWSGGKPGNVPVYKNRMPLAIVDIFERHGFVWGGRWYHYDTMHFEYRPELIAISHAAGADTCRAQ